MASLWVNEGPLWRMVMTKKIQTHFGMDDQQTTGWVTVKRWVLQHGVQVPHGPGIDYYSKTGRKAIQVTSVNGEMVRCTWYQTRLRSLYDYWAKAK